MTSKRFRQLVAALAGAAALTASAGLMASSGQEPGAARPAATPENGQPSPDDQVEALVREFEDASLSPVRRSLDFAKDREKIRAAGEQAAKRRRDVSKRFLELAERSPRTNAAEQALTWLVAHDDFSTRSPDVERARVILARDHARSDRIKDVLAKTSSATLWGSPATEDLLRSVLERNPYREIRGLACYGLAKLLIARADEVRTWQLMGSPIERNLRAVLGGPEHVARLMKSDPRRFEDEAAPLLERVIAEFPLVQEDQRGKTEFWPTIGQAAKVDLDRLRRLAIGKPAAEIDGVDLDERPMTPSEYRGKVVVLYFSPLSSMPPGSREPTLVIHALRRLTAAVSGKPAVVLGATAWHRDEFRTAIRASGLPVRFWWDRAKPDNIVGPIHAAWDAYDSGFGATCYVLDPRGTIRYKLPGNAALVEKAVAKLLEEPKSAG
jgi:peroxiredoxin